jgi:hypothetical protein
VTIERLPDPDVLLEETDWAGLDHPFRGHEEFPAVPVMLGGLLTGAGEARARSLHLLTEAINHQNTVYEVTTPVLLWVGASLGDPRIDKVLIPGYPAWRGQSPLLLRAALLDVLRQVVQDADDATVQAAGRHGYDCLSDPPFQQVRATRPALFSAVSLWREDPDLRLREASAAAVIALLDAPELAHLRVALAPGACAALIASADERYRAIARRFLDASPSRDRPPSIGVIAQDQPLGFADDPPF